MKIKIHNVPFYVLACLVFVIATACSKDEPNRTGADTDCGQILTTHQWKLHEFLLNHHPDLNACADDDTLYFKVDQNFIHDRGVIKCDTDVTGDKQTEGTWEIIGDSTIHLTYIYFGGALTFESYGKILYCNKDSFKFDGYVEELPGYFERKDVTVTYHAIP